MVRARATVTVESRSPPLSKVAASPSTFQHIASIPEPHHSSPRRANWRANADPFVVPSSDQLQSWQEARRLGGPRKAGTESRTRSRVLALSCPTMPEFADRTAQFRPSSSARSSSPDRQGLSYRYPDWSNTSSYTTSCVSVEPYHVTRRDTTPTRAPGEERGQVVAVPDAALPVRPDMNPFHVACSIGRSRRNFMSRLR